MGGGARMAPERGPEHEGDARPPGAGPRGGEGDAAGAPGDDRAVGPGAATEDLTLGEVDQREGQRTRGDVRGGVVGPAAEAQHLDPDPLVERREGRHAVGRYVRSDEQDGIHPGYVRGVGRRRPEIALVSLATTPGLRHADAALTAALVDVGCRVRVRPVALGPSGALRRHIAVTDLVESVAAARVARGTSGADAVIASGATTAFFLPGDPPLAVWFDSPSALNRPGTAGAWQRAAERRVARRAKLLLPWGDAAAGAAIAAGLGAGVPLPVPVEGRPEAAERDLDAVAYAGWPWKRGLDVLCAAWGRVGSGRLVVGGVDAARGRAWLARCGVPEPPGVEWPGLLGREAWLGLVGRARVFVNASRREDYGIAQLEALSAGTPLVTVPSPGAYEALGLARALAPALVDADLDRALAAGLALTTGERVGYAERASERLVPYRPEAMRERLREEVLPRLLATSA